MAELRTEIGEFQKRVDAVHDQVQREHAALKVMHEALVARAEEETAAQGDSDKLKAIEPKIAALEIQPAGGKPKASSAATSATPHAKG